MRVCLNMGYYCVGIGIPTVNNNLILWNTNIDSILFTGTNPLYTEKLHVKHNNT